MSPAPLPPPPSVAGRAAPGATGVGTRRRWLPTFIVLAVILATVLGGYVVAGALSVPTGAPIDVGGITRVQPLSGWQDAGRFEAAGAPAARITRGSGSLDVLAAPFGGTDADLLRVYVNEVLEPDAVRLSVAPNPERVPVAGGLEGLRVAYVGEFDRGGAAIEGEVTALVSPSGAGVVFDGWAPEGLLRFTIPDIHVMEETAVVS